MARSLPLGQPALRGARGRRCRPVDHAGGDGHGDRASSARSVGHPTRTTKAGQGRPGNGDARPAQRRPAHARRRPGERPVRERVLDDRRGARRPPTRGHARRVARRSWRPPGPAKRCITAASTTRSTACVSCPGRYSGRAYRCGLPATTASSGRCCGRRGTRDSSPSASTTRTSSPRSSPSLAALHRDAGRDLTEPYDIVIALEPGDDPAPYAAAGATWWLVAFPWDAPSVDHVRAVIREGPAAA